MQIIPNIINLNIMNILSILKLIESLIENYCYVFLN